MNNIDLSVSTKKYVTKVTGNVIYKDYNEMFHTHRVPREMQLRVNRAKLSPKHCVCVSTIWTIICFASDLSIVKRNESCGCVVVVVPS